MEPRSARSPPSGLTIKAAPAAAFLTVATELRPRLRRRVVGATTAPPRPPLTAAAGVGRLGQQVAGATMAPPRPPLTTAAEAERLWQQVAEATTAPPRPLLTAAAGAERLWQQAAWATTAPRPLPTVAVRAGGGSPAHRCGLGRQPARPLLGQRSPSPLRRRRGIGTARRSGPDCRGLGSDTRVGKAPSGEGSRLTIQPSKQNSILLITVTEPLCWSFL
jgi:hypothetical protein